jgi:hypothetical protein
MATFDELRLQQLLRPFENQSGIIGTNTGSEMMNNIPLINTADILNQYNVPGLQNKDLLNQDLINQIIADNQRKTKMIIEDDKVKTVPISYPNVSDAPLRFATDDQASFFFPSNTNKGIMDSTVASNIPFGTSVDNIQGFTDKVDFSKPQEPTGIAKLASYFPLGENSMVGSVIRSFIPKADPAAKFMNNFYRNRFGLTDIGQVASGIMKGYNPVSGGLINRITKGKYGDPMKIGLQGAYQKRIDRIKKTLQDKYLSKGRSLDETELDERLALLEQLKLDELNAFKQFIKSKSPQSKGLGDIGSAGIDKTIKTGGAAEDKPSNAFAPLKDTFSGGKVKDVKSVPGGKYGSPR